MHVSARWRRVDGRPFIAITLPGGFTAAIPQYYAWQLKNELERVLATVPPKQADNGEHGN